MIDMPKYCKFCGTELLGRADKKFCDGKCRSKHHAQMDRINRENSEALKTAIKLGLDKLTSNNQFDKQKINDLNGFEKTLESLRINELTRIILAIRKNLEKL